MTHDTLLGVDLRARAQALHPSLQALARGLREELRPLETRGFPVPPQKAMLTRVGGRCPHDGTALRFDPWAPHVHTCPQCGREQRGEAHDAWWAMGAQLWCAERALHAALLGRCFGDEALLALAARGLADLGEAWPRYPDRDNALGPTRPFFSTYLESVWLLTVSLAAQCLAPVPAHATLVSHLADRVIAPSRALIASFPEGRSNRQAWHVAARLVASQLLGDAAHAEEALHGRDGLVALLRDGLLTDGSWYEGENYHLFAHRGLWFGLAACASKAAAVPRDLVARFDRGFRAPWMGVLPDGTFPSRRDARYAVSVHQWRFAEWCELGLARGDDPVLRRWLQRLYASSHPAGDTGRWRATGEIERDESPVALTRADLGWRALLFARNEPWPPPVSSQEESVRLDAQGLAVLRRDAGRLYVAVEGGHPGGGHGHPDRLALTIQDGTRRVLEDPGTGSYVERTLHWYRSTLAHNAPLVDGASQRRVPTRLLAFEGRAVGGLVQVEAREVAPGAVLRRTVVLVDDHVVDCCAWVAEREVQVELPLHVDVEARPDAHGVPAWRAADPGGAGGLEDGFDFLTQVERADALPASPLRLLGADGLTVWTAVVGTAAEDTSVWRAIAPGPPGRPARRVHWWRARGREGAMLTVWSLRGRVHEAQLASESVRVRTTDGLEVLHVRADTGWLVHLVQGDARSSVHFAAEPVRPSLAARSTESDPAPVDTAADGTRSVVAHREVGPRPSREPDPPPDVHLDDARPTWSRALGADHYRRSEQSWTEAGSPSAVVTLALAPDGALRIAVDAATGEVVVPTPGAINRFDNERPEVNADGVQVHLGRPGADRWHAAWLCVPSPGERAARVVVLEAPVMTSAPSSSPPVATSLAPLATAWTPTARGFHLTLLLPASVLATAADDRGSIALDVLVNERPAERERRRGQLVLSGAAGEWVYLRGDRQDPHRALRVAGPWRADPGRHAPGIPTSRPA